jgi:glycerophosphoryl diester phosphodiesterase
MARELGADYLEADIQRTRDGVLVCFHDDDLARTTDVARVFPGREREALGSFTFEELGRLDAGSWFNQRHPGRARPSFQGLKIMRLDELVDLAGTKERLYLETKSAHLYPGIEEQIVKLLKEKGNWLSGGAEGRLILQSFEPVSLAKLEVLAPGILKVLLVEDVVIQEWGWPRILRKHRELAGAIGPSRDWLGQPWRIWQAHRAGLLVHVWTIDRAWEMRLLDWLGADGIFTNRSELALQVFGRSGPADLASAWARNGF